MANLRSKTNAHKKPPMSLRKPMLSLLSAMVVSGCIRTSTEMADSAQKTAERGATDPSHRGSQGSETAYCVLMTKDWTIGSGALTVLQDSKIFSYGDTGMFYRLMVGDSEFERARIILLKYSELEPYVRKRRAKEGY